MYSTKIEERTVTKEVKEAAVKLESQLTSTTGDEELKEDEELMHSSVVRTEITAT
jgi:hypothetical protein